MIASIDHVAVPTARPDELIEFYRGLGFAVVGEEEWRAGSARIFSLCLGDSKINVHPPELWRQDSFELRGPSARPGCLDLCVVWTGTVEAAVAMIERSGGVVVAGPAERVGGRGAGTVVGTSVYTRDPDGNLLELIAYPVAPEQYPLCTKQIGERR